MPTYVRWESYLLLGTHYKDQPVSTSPVLGLRVCATIPNLGVTTYRD